MATHGYVNNGGLFEKTGGAGTSSLALNVENSGTIEATSGALDLQDALWGNGETEIADGATIEVDGAVDARQTFLFNGAERCRCKTSTSAGPICSMARSAASARATRWT